MKIDELIDELEQVKEEHGNLEVAQWSERDNLFNTIENTRIEVDVDTEKKGDFQSRHKIVNLLDH